MDLDGLCWRMRRKESLREPHLPLQIGCCAPKCAALEIFPDGDEAVAEEYTDTPNLTQITAEVVSVYVAHNQIAPADVARLITVVAGAFTEVGSQREPAPEARPEPAVPVRRSVARDHLTCLLCGKQQKLLKRHLAVAHDLTPAAYREMFDLKPDYPMAAPGYVEQRRALALEIGLGRPKAAPPRRRRKAAAGAGQRPRTVSAGADA
jgi:predicted transcriptional regulator